MVFQDFSCSFQAKTFNCIVGRSGIGKSTLLNILLGLDQDYRGSIEGLESRDLSVIFQENRLLEDFSIRENINFVLDEKIEDHLLRGYLRSLRLGGLEDKKVSSLSGGMKRRVTILRAVLKRADIYIFDEPFKDMDDETHLLVLEFIRAELEGKTVIFTSHSSMDLDFLKPNIIRV